MAGNTPGGTTGADGEAAVQARGLVVVRGGRTVLRGLDFDVATGSVVGVLGPSGSGKSTLMRALVGVQRHVRGDVRVLGHPAGEPGLRRSVAYVTQAPSVYEDLTVDENLGYFARVLGVNDRRVAGAVEAVGLDDAAGQPVADLSGGQRSRVSLATALLGDPDLLVLDEPTVSLDPVLRVSLWETFHHLAGEGATLLVSSHVMDEADRCDRVLVLRDGRLVVDDTADGMRRRTGCERLDDAFVAVVTCDPEEDER